MLQLKEICWNNCIKFQVHYFEKKWMFYSLMTCVLVNTVSILILFDPTFFLLKMCRDVKTQGLQRMILFIELFSSLHFK